MTRTLKIKVLGKSLRMSVTVTTFKARIKTLHPHKMEDGMYTPSKHKDPQGGTMEGLKIIHPLAPIGLWCGKKIFMSINK